MHRLDWIVDGVYMDYFLILGLLLLSMDLVFTYFLFGPFGYVAVCSVIINHDGRVMVLAAIAHLF